MISFKDFINEKIVSRNEKDELKTAKEMMDIISSGNLFKEKVLYRGFSGMRQPFAEITNLRTGFYGGLNQNVSTFIRKYLKVTNPTFASTETLQASMFGSVCIFLPHAKDELYYSNTIRDLLVNLDFDNKTTEEFEDLLSKYKTSNIKTMKKHSGEIIVSTKKYYLIDYMRLSKSFNSKFFKPKSSIENLTYQDVYDLLKSYVGLAEWKIKNGKRVSFEQQNLNDDKQRNRMAKLRQDRSSPEQLKIRLEVMKKFMHDFEYEEEGFSLVFKTQKAAKEAWKYIKPKMESRQNQSIMMDLSKTEYINGDLVKNKIIIK